MPETRTASAAFEKGAKALGGMCLIRELVMWQGIHYLFPTQFRRRLVEKYSSKHGYPSLSVDGCDLSQAFVTVEAVPPC